MSKFNLLLVPNPKKVDIIKGIYSLKNKGNIVIAAEDKEQIFMISKRLQIHIKKELDIKMPIIVGNIGQNISAIYFIKDNDLSEEMYKLSVKDSGIVIQYNDFKAAFHAVSTLKQIISQCQSNLPYLIIEDQPDFKNRGIMLDVSRDKIPTMETLFKLIDFMADIKLNQLQLYIEGFSFAYQSYKLVWEEGTPITGEEIIEIDRYCKERYIEFVPNHNSFGHMTSWLMKEEFKHLAECPDGFKGDYYNNYGKPSCIDPTNAESIKFIKRLYDDFLPYFSSEFINVGCDETFELGLGNSKETCEKIGKNRVYLDFVLNIYEEVHKMNKKMMLWGDIIINYPELVKELPKDVIALEWGYESGHPFKKNLEIYKNAGIEFYVCPGTSAWNSITGRTKNMKENLLNAAIYGKKNGSIGYLITDWGDHGHWQYLPVSYPGFIYGAALSWSVNRNENIDIVSYLNKFVYKDQKNIMGKLVLDLGNYYLLENETIENNTYLFKMFRTNLEYDQMPISDLMGKVKLFDETEQYIKALEDRLELVQMRCDEGDLIYSEFKNAIRFIKHFVNYGKVNVWIQSGEQKHELIYFVEKMRDEFKELIQQHEQLWLKRNRAGGLESSISYLKNFQ